MSLLYSGLVEARQIYKAPWHKHHPYDVGLYLGIYAGLSCDCRISGLKLCRVSTLTGLHQVYQIRGFCQTW